MKFLRLLLLTLTISPLFAGIDEDLIQAAKNGDVKSVTELLDRGADIHAKDWKGKNAPLIYAAFNGHIEIVRLLLDRGANVHAKNLWGETPLISAAQKGYKDIVQLLLEHGADIHSEDDEALRGAAEHGHTDTVRLLLDRSANIHACDDAPLKWAAYNGHTETVVLLLDHGANIATKDHWALRWAAYNGHTETVRLLLDRSANIHARDWSGSDVPLRRAAKNGHTDTVRLLLDRGSDVHAENDEALRWAAQSSHHRVVAMLELCAMKSFEEFREDPLAFIENQTHAEKPVPPQLLLLWTVILNREDAFDQLLNISVANAMDKNHMTALMYASLFGNENMCAKLVHTGAKIKLKNEWGQTAIQLAADAGYWNIASYLLRRLPKQVKIKNLEAT